jgi:hypothetical protein
VVPPFAFVTRLCLSFEYRACRRRERPKRLIPPARENPQRNTRYRGAIICGKQLASHVAFRFLRARHTQRKCIYMHASGQAGQSRDMHFFSSGQHKCRSRFGPKSFQNSGPRKSKILSEMVDPKRVSVVVNPISADAEPERHLGNSEEFWFPRGFIRVCLSRCGRALSRGIGWVRDVRD